MPQCGILSKLKINQGMNALVNDQIRRLRELLADMEGSPITAMKVREHTAQLSSDRAYEWIGLQIM